MSRIGYLTLCSAPRPHDGRKREGICGRQYDAIKHDAGPVRQRVLAGRQFGIVIKLGYVQMGGVHIPEKHRDEEGSRRASHGRDWLGFTPAKHQEQQRSASREIEPNVPSGPAAITRINDCTKNANESNQTRL